MTFDPEAYASGLRAFNDREKKLLESRLAEALEESQKIIDRLLSEASCTKAVVFGSVAKGTVRNLQFDIDIAIWGGDIMVAQEIAMESDFSVDIVEYERVPAHIQKSIDEVN